MEAYIIYRKHENENEPIIGFRQESEAQEFFKKILKFFRISKFQNLFDIEQIDLPFIGRSLSFIDIYKGFDYDLDSLSIDELACRSNLYSFVEDAKKDPIWIKYANIAEKDPNNHFISNERIASLDGGTPFSWGDAMEDKFNMVIKHIKIYNSEYVNIEKLFGY